MSPHFTFATFIIPYCIFVFSLYIALVPKKLSPLANKSTKRIILCYLGAVFGLFTSITTLIYTRNDMDQAEGYRFILGLAIFSWCGYSLLTNHSNLSKVKKIAKVIIYWFITGCFLSASSYHKSTREGALFFNFILTIIAHYTVCDREILETPQKKHFKKRGVKQNSIFQRICEKLKSITPLLKSIWQYCVKNKKIIIITAIIIIVLWLLPFYIEYFISNSGIKSLLKHRHYY